MQPVPTEVRMVNFPDVDFGPFREPHFCDAHVIQAERLPRAMCARG